MSLLFFLVTGTLSVTYLVSFVAVKASKWGFHLNFQGANIPNDLHNIYIPGKFVRFSSTRSSLKYMYIIGKDFKFQHMKTKVYLLNS